MSAQYTLQEELIPYSTKATRSLENYTILRSLDHPGGSIYFAYDNNSDTQVILKTFSCSPTVKLSYIHERNNLRRFSHPNLINLHDYKDNAILCVNNAQKRVSYIALEYAPLGDLCDVMLAYGTLPEILARMIFHQVLDAVSYLHENGTAHMDLKPDNIVMDSNYNIKIIDFDHSTNLKSKHFEARGTANYRCPEVIKGMADDLRACDIYSLGVILFVLILACHPYMEHVSEEGVTYDVCYRLLRRNPKEFWKFFIKGEKSSDRSVNSFMSLVTKMLHADPSKRPTIDEVKSSTWFNGPVYTRKEYEKEMIKYFKTKL